MTKEASFYFLLGTSLGCYLIVQTVQLGRISVILLAFCWTVMLARWTVVAHGKTYDVYWYQACYFPRLLPQPPSP